MKATLEFDLSDPDQKQDFKVATTGREARMVLWDLQYTVLRPMYKHGMFKDKTLTEEQMLVVEYISDQFFEILNAHNIDLDD